MNSRERVKQALLCRKPDRIPKALGFFDQDLAAIVLMDLALQDVAQNGPRTGSLKPPQSE